MHCSSCNKDAVVFQRYSGLHLCKQHFRESVRKRVFKEFHSQVRLKGGEKIMIAYSGGKDSTLTLHMLSEILSPMRDVSLEAVIVDEGVKGYRDAGLPVAKRVCKKLGIDLTVVRMSKEIGITLDEIAKQERAQSTCTFCGVFRRRLMNAAAREAKADYLATGLNLDDTAQSIVMNIFRGDVEKLARMGPHDLVQKGLVRRIQPLRRIPEKESLLYCIEEELEFHDAECSYAPEAARNVYREMIARMEEEYPGTRYSILSSYDSMRDALRKMYPPAKLKTCACGEPSIEKTCKGCRLVAEVTRKRPITSS